MVSDGGRLRLLGLRLLMSLFAIEITLRGVADLVKVIVVFEGVDLVEFLSQKSLLTRVVINLAVLHAQ